jgi:hypothetical protein
MLKASLVLAALAALAGCSFDPGAPARTLGHLDTEQLECPWIDDNPITVLPESKLGCWCVQGTAVSRPTAPADGTSPCDAVDLPMVYCAPSGAPVKTWHKMTADNDAMPLVEIDCADIPG